MFQILKNWSRDLRNFFFYKYRQFNRKTFYPTSILPKPNFKYPLNFDFLSKHLNLYVVRTADTSCNEIFNEVGLLRDGIIPPKEVPGLSMNLLGGRFSLNYIKYRALNAGSAYWYGKTKVSFADFFHDYQTLPMYCPLIYQVDKIHNIAVPFLKPKDKTTEKFLAASNLTAEVYENNYKINGRTTLIHAPVNINYWHVELNMNISENIKVKREDSSSKWIKNAEMYVVEHLLSFPMTKKPVNMQPINLGYYNH